MTISIVFSVLIFLLSALIFFYSGKGVPVLLYHQVYPSAATTPDLLEQHFQYISQKGFHTLTCAEIYPHKKLAPKSLLITFDDGYYDNFLYVFPLLKKYNLKATFFINTAYIPQLSDNRGKLEIISDVLINNAAVRKLYKTGNGQSDYYMSWEEIKIMHQSGLCDFQAHSHRHKCVFTSNKLKSIIEKPEFDSNQYHSYEGAPAIGYPMFKARGEMTARKMEIQKNFIQFFSQEYEKTIKHLSENKRIKYAKAFIKKHSSSTTFQWETEEVFEERIRKELMENRSAIEKNLGNKVKFLAWPWGHHTVEGRKACEKAGIEGFFTCRKKTNPQKINFARINRTEIRKPSLSKLRILLSIQSNLFLGKLAGLFT